MAFKPIVNYRSAPVLTESPEAFTVTGGVALLAEAPADPGTYAMTVTVDGNPRTRVTGTPTAGQYRVRVQAVTGSDLVPRVEYLPILELHSSDEGLSGTCAYYRTGSVLTSEWFADFVTFLKPLTGVADSGSLPAATTDVLARGGPGDVAFLANGSLWFSDGVTWTGAAGGAGAKVTVTKTATAGALVQGSFTKDVTADGFVNESASQVNVDVTADAAVQTTVTKTLDADAVVDPMHMTATVTADAAVKTTVTKTVDADASVSEGSSSGISLVGTPVAGTGAGSNITLPSGRQSNDIIVVVKNDGSTAPTGWTRKVNDNAGTATVAVYYRRADGTSTDNFSVASYAKYACAIYRGCTTSGDPFEAAGSSASEGETSGGALSVTGITTATNNAWVLGACSGLDLGWDDGEGGAGANSGPTWASASGAVATLDASTASVGEAPNTVAVALYHSVKTTAGSTGTASVRFYMTGYAGGSQGTYTKGILLALKPA